MESQGQDYNLTRFFQLQSGLAQYHYTVSKQQVPPQTQQDSCSTIPLKQKVMQIKDGIQLDFTINLNNEEIKLSNQILFYDTTPVQSQQQSPQAVNESHSSISNDDQQEKNALSMNDDKNTDFGADSISNFNSLRTTPMNSPFFSFTTKKDDEDTFMHLDIQQDNYSQSTTEEETCYSMRKRTKKNYTNMSPLPYQKKQSLFYEKLSGNKNQRVSPKKSAKLSGYQQQTDLGFQLERYRKNSGNNISSISQKLKKRIEENALQQSCDYQINNEIDIKTLLNTKRTDKKNVVKNFIKAFRGFILNPDKKELIKDLCPGVFMNNQEFVDFQKRFISFEKSNHYNNKFMKDLISNQLYNCLFSYFLENEAIAWLENSLVHDKEGHKIMLQFYIKACQNPQFLDKMKVLKKEENNYRNNKIYQQQQETVEEEEEEDEQQQKQEIVQQQFLQKESKNNEIEQQLAQQC